MAGGKQLITVDVELVRDVLGLLRMRAGGDNVRSVLALIGVMRVLHEQAENVDLELTGQEIKHAFLNLDLGKLGKKGLN